MTVKRTDRKDGGKLAVKKRTLRDLTPGKGDEQGARGGASLPKSRAAWSRKPGLGISVGGSFSN